MTSITTAPRPIRNAQRNPRRAPSLIMVKLIGPTGTESRKPLTKPVRPATSMGGRWNILAPQSGAAAHALDVILAFFFLLDFVSDLARDARADEAIDQVNGKQNRQDDLQDFFPEQDQARDEQHDDHHFCEGPFSA